MQTTTSKTYACATAREIKAVNDFTSKGVNGTYRTIELYSGEMGYEAITSNGYIGRHPNAFKAVEIATDLHLRAKRERSAGFGVPSARYGWD